MNPKEVFAAARALACACFATAKCAQRLGIELFTTTLAGSRWKRLDQIREAAEEAARLTPGTRYWDMNWRKGGLQQRRGELLAQEGFTTNSGAGANFPWDTSPCVPRKTFLHMYGIS